VQVPEWYIISKLRVPYIQSSESMLGMNSKASFGTVLAQEGFEVVS
jgi:hypothetical protein